MFLVCTGITISVDMIRAMITISDNVIETTSHTLEDSSTSTHIHPRPVYTYFY